MVASPLALELQLIRQERAPVTATHKQFSVWQGLFDREPQRWSWHGQEPTTVLWSLAPQHQLSEDRAQWGGTK